MAIRFNTPPGWPPAPEGWLPPAGWQPDPSWPAPPEGWQLFVDDARPQVPANPGHANLPAVFTPPDVMRQDERRDPVTLIGVPVSAPPPAEAAPPPEGAIEPGVLWAAKGQPFTGIGGGRYKLTATMLFFEKGLLSTNGQQVPIAHVLDVDLRQSMVQKGRGVGNIVVQVQRSNGVEWVVLEDIPDPRKALSIINKAVQDARLIEQQRMNTHLYANLPPVPPAPQPVLATPTPPPAPAGRDPIEQLRQLGELRDAGILTEEEFATKKAEILSRM